MAAALLVFAMLLLVDLLRLEGEPLETAWGILVGLQYAWSRASLLRELLRVLRNLEDANGDRARGHLDFLEPGLPGRICAADLRDSPL